MLKLTERRSIRQYDPNVKISREEMLKILNDTMRAPSSKNMQPSRFVVVESFEAKEKLRPLLFGNQIQLETSAAMIIIFTDLHKYDNAEKIFNRAYDLNIIPADVRDRQIESVVEIRKTLVVDNLEKPGLIDGGLIAMQLMHVARAYGYDTCPIGGFRHGSIAEAFDLDPKRYKPVLIVSIGKSAEEGYKSYRLDASEVTYFK
ncbi:MAG: nitroreductase family protein [Acholeplasmataceae bacterium]